MPDPARPGQGSHLTYTTLASLGFAGRVASRTPVPPSKDVTPRPPQATGLLHATCLLFEGAAAPLLVSKQLRTPRGWVSVYVCLVFAVLPVAAVSVCFRCQSTGRLEIFARYGPVDEARRVSVSRSFDSASKGLSFRFFSYEAGKLRGGISGSHVHTVLASAVGILHLPAMEL